MSGVTEHTTGGCRTMCIPRSTHVAERHYRGFTLIELLVVIAIISTLISILMPSLSRARAQAKSVHCLARLKDIGHAIGVYENDYGGALPPARWFPAEEDLRRDGIGGIPVAGLPGPETIEYGWAELLFAHVYAEPVRLPDNYPAQRNIDGPRWQAYFVCEAVGDEGPSSGHYRVYLPAWSAHSYALEADEVYGETTRANPDQAAHRERIRAKLPLMGDSNEYSERGDGWGQGAGDPFSDDDCSYIDAGEANYAGSDGRRNGNRFSDRHYGGTNFLFQDLHASWQTKLREELARDYDLNGIIDIDVEP